MEIQKRYTFLGCHFHLSGPEFHTSRVEGTTNEKDLKERRKGLGLKVGRGVNRLRISRKFWKKVN